MKEKKMFEEPASELIRVDSSDVIATSGGPNLPDPMTGSGNNDITGFGSVNMIGGLRQ